MMLNINRRRFCQFLAASTGLTITSNWSFASASPLRKLTIGGSPIIITVLLAYVSEQPQIQSLAQEVDFRIWKTHDQLRADAVSRKLQISATPTTLAAGLYQKGLNIKLLNVLVWGVLNLWSWGSNYKQLDRLIRKKDFNCFSWWITITIFYLSCR